MTSTLVPSRFAVLAAHFRVAALPIILMAECLAYGQARDQNPVEELERLLQQKQYIQLERRLSANQSVLAREELAYFSGVMANRTLQVTNSIRLLEPLLPVLRASNPVRAESVLCTLADDYAKDFRYADAAMTYSEAQRVAEQLGQASECDAGQEASRWALLSGAPAQTINDHGPFTVVRKEDGLGLFQIPVTAENYSGFWVADSGANLSVISRSVANRLGVAVSSEEETAQGIGGLSVVVHAAVIPEIRVGKAVLHNVAVLVVEDSELRFPNIGYQIEGSLGMPVLRALGRITFHADGRVDFAGTSRKLNQGGPHNLFFERFTPLVVADFGHGNQLFSLDTGAVGTILSNQFLQEDEGLIATGDLIDLQLIGAGGDLTAPAYVAHDLAARFAGQCARLKNVQVLMQSTGLPDEFYGNVGQNALSQFSSFTLDFNAMSLTVTGGTPNACR
jgi:predicted aspartyl protease